MRSDPKHPVVLPDGHRLFKVRVREVAEYELLIAAEDATEATDFATSLDLDTDYEPAVLQTDAVRCEEVDT